MTAVAPEKLVFPDECGFALNLHRFYGWVSGGGRCCQEVPFQRGKNRSVVGAFSLPAGTAGTAGTADTADTADNGMRALWHKLGAMTREDFEHFLRDHLLPELSAGHVLVLDNARIHHGGHSQEWVEAAGCSLLHLPPYSPDLSPIELAWSWIKNCVRAQAPRDDESRQQAIQDAAAQMPAHAAPRWFKMCGYGLP